MVGYNPIWNRFAHNKKNNSGRIAKSGEAMRARNHLVTTRPSNVSRRQRARQVNSCVALKIGDPAAYAAIKNAFRRR